MKKNVRKLPNYIKKEIVKVYSDISLEKIIDYMNKYNVQMTMKDEFFKALDNLSRRSISHDIYMKARCMSYDINEEIIDETWSTLADKYIPSEREIFNLKKKNDSATKAYLNAYKRIQNYKYKNKTNKKAQNMSKLAFRRIRDIYNEYLADNLSLDSLILLLSEYNYNYLDELAKM